MSQPDPSTDKPRMLDPVLIHARRESVIILILFGIHMVWSITWCYWNGYHLPPDQPVNTLLGIPTWIFWGVIVPWLGVDLFSIWFCLWYMALDPLGEDAAESEFPPQYNENREVE